LANALISKLRNAAICQTLKKRAKMEVIGEIKETTMVIRTEGSGDNLVEVIAPASAEEGIKEVDIKTKKADTKTKEAADIKIKVAAGVIKIEAATEVETKLGMAIMKKKSKIIIKMVVTKTGEDRAMIMGITKKEEVTSHKVANKNFVRT
jgi:hypothetical protein